MSALPPFNATGMCPKCAARNLSSRYVEDGKSARYASAAWRNQDALPAMERTCTVCGFQTLEAPLSPADTLITPPVSVRMIELPDGLTPPGLVSEDFI